MFKSVFSNHRHQIHFSPEPRHQISLAIETVQFYFQCPKVSKLLQKTTTKRIVAILGGAGRAVINFLVKTYLSCSKRCNEQFLGFCLAIALPQTLIKVLFTISNPTPIWLRSTHATYYHLPIDFHGEDIGDSIGVSKNPRIPLKVSAFKGNAKRGKKPQEFLLSRAWKKALRVLKPVPQFYTGTSLLTSSKGIITSRKPNIPIRYLWQGKILEHNQRGHRARVPTFSFDDATMREPRYCHRSSWDPHSTCTYRYTRTPTVTFNHTNQTDRSHWVTSRGSSP